MLVVSFKYIDVVIILQGSTRADNEAWLVGVVWAEFMDTSIDFLPTSVLY